MGMKLYIVGRRYGYSAIDQVDVEDYMKHGGIERTVATNLTSKVAHQMAYNLNQAYSEGYYDATGKWKHLTPEQKKAFKWFFDEQAKKL